MCVHACVCASSVNVCLYVQCYLLRNPLTVPPAIPHFKEVIVMALTCDTCGYRLNEVSQGQGSVKRGHGSHSPLLTPVTSQGTYTR